MRFVPLGQDDSPSQEDQYTFVPLDTSSQASTQPEVSGDTDQEVITSARAWRGAAGGRGSFADPRRLDQESGRTLQKVEKNLDQLEKVNPHRSREELRPYAGNLASAPESTAKPVDRVQQYADKADASQYKEPSGLIESAQKNAAFDQRKQDTSNRTMQMRDADPVTGEKIVQSYNPNSEAQRVKAEETDLSDARLAVIGRGVAEEFNPALRGIVKGGIQSLGLGAAAIGFAADAMGADGVKAWGLDVNRQTGRLANQLTLSKNATDIQSIDEFQTWLAENGGYTLYQAAESLLTAGIGGAAGKAIGKEAVGQVVAMTANNIRQTLGSVYAEAVDEAKRTGKPMPSLAQIAAGAVVSGAVDTFADKLGLDALTAAGFKGNALGRLTKSLGTQMSVQGGTEALQVIPESLGAGKDPFTREGFKQMLDEGAVGALGGGGPGVMGAINRYQEPAPVMPSAEQMALDRGFLTPSVTSFADPNGPASRAGITPIVVPTPQNVSTPSNTGGLAAGAGNGGSPVVGPSVGDMGQVGGVGRGMGDAAGIAQPVSTGNPSVPQPSGQPSTSVNPVKRTADSDLLSKVAYEEDGTTKATTEGAAPDSIWTGRSGAGYDTVEFAQQALESRAKKDPELNWKVEQRPDGKYHLAGYSTGDTNGQAATPVVAGQPAARDSGDAVRNEAGLAPQGDPANVRGRENLGDATAAADLSSRIGKPLTLVTPEAVRGLPANAPRARAYRVFNRFAGVAQAAFGYKPVAISGLGNYGVQYDGRAYVDIDEMSDGQGEGVAGMVLHTMGHEVGHTMQKSSDPEDKAAYQGLRSVVVQYAKDGVIARRQRFEDGAAVSDGLKAPGKDYAIDEVVNDVNGGMWRDSKFWGMLYDLDSGSTMRRIAYKFMQAATKVIGAAKKNGYNDIDTLVGENIEIVREAAAKAWADRAMRKGKDFKARPALTADLFDTDPSMSRKGVVGEVAPHPGKEYTGDVYGVDVPVPRNILNERQKVDRDRKETAGDWDGMQADEKTMANRDVAKRIFQAIVDARKLKGWSLSFSTGQYLGKTNPNFIIDAPEDATWEQLRDVASEIGFVLDQQSMVAFDENDTSGRHENGFVKVILPKDFPASKLQELRDLVKEKFPQADSNTQMKPNELVFGNFTKFGDNELSDAEFKSGINTAIEALDWDGEAILAKDPERYASELIWPDNRLGYLKDQEYGKGNLEQARQGEGRAILRGEQGNHLLSLRKLARESIGRRQDWIDKSVSGRARAGVQQRALADATQSTAKAEREYGVAREGSVAKVGVHFSQQRRKLLSSEFHGSGLKGAERDRAQSSDYIKDRLFFYVDNGKGVTPEAGVGGVRHIVKLKNLYDASKDPKGFSRMSTGPTEQERQTKFENFVKNAGFDGYFMDKGGNQDFAVLVGKHGIEMPSYSRRFKSVDEFDSEPQDFDRMNELGNFSVDTNDASDDFAFPDLSGANEKLDKQAELQAELDKQFRKRMVDKSKLKAGPAAVTLEKMEAGGLNPELAFSLGEMTEMDGTIEFDGAAGFPEAGDMYEVSEFPTGWRVGTEHSFTMGNNWTKEGAIRQFRNLVTAPFIHKAGFDIAENYRKGTALKLAQTWRNLAGKHGTFKLPARSKSMNFAEVAKEIGAISGYDILVEGNNRKEITFTDKSNGNTFNASIAMLNDGSFKCCTMGLDGSKIGSEFYAVASEWARNNGYSFASDAALSAVNGFRRTEQATSYALKTGDTGVILPGVQNRVYGYNEKPVTKEDHDMNIARLLLAGMRNAMEVDPEIRRLRYTPETGKFTDSKGNDAEATVKAFLSNKDARASGMGRSTLARAVLTSQIIAGGFDAGAVTEFAEPVAYSRKMGVDSALSEAYGSDPSTDGAKTEFSPQFNEWFGKSKVVNENGKPLVVYHGTKAPPTQFERSRTGMASTFLGDYEVERHGIFAAEDPQLADEYANQGERPTNQTVMPLFMSIKSPLDTVSGDYTDSMWSIISSAAKRMGAENPYATARFIGDLWGRGALWKLFDADESNDPAWNIAMLKEAGYDGMRIYERSKGDVGNTAAWVAFDPTQIKSVFNNGDFDGANPDIRYSRKQLDDYMEQRRKTLNLVSPQSVLDKDIDMAVRAIEIAVGEIADGNREMLPIPLGRIPHALTMLGAQPQMLRIDTSIVRKIFLGKHAGELGDITPNALVRAIYQPAMILKGEQKGEYEFVTSLVTPKGVVFVPIRVDSTSRESGMKSSAVMSVYEKNVSGAGRSIVNRIKSGDVLYADPEQAQVAVTGRGSVPLVGINAGEAQFSHAPPTKGQDSNVDDAQNSVKPASPNFVGWSQVRDIILGGIRDKKIKTDLDRLGWVGKKYKAENSPDGWSDAPSFARKQATGLPEETNLQRFQRVMQDQYNRVKLVQDLLVESGGLVGDEQDVYRAEERMHGRVHELMRQFKDDVVQPFLDKAVAEKVDLNELALYSYAMHAKERNAHIQTFNKNVNTGSGMSDDTADNIIQMVELAGDRVKFDDLHNDMMAMTATTRRVMLDEGLITQDQYDGLENMYQHYVPLRGFEDVEAETGKVRPGLGRGFNVKGKETIAAMGRDSAAGDIIENIIRDYERVTIRSEKNAVGKTFLDLVQNNPDPNLWEVQPIKRAARKDANGLVQYQNVDDKGEDTVAVKVGGQGVYIKIHDELFLRAMQNTFKGEKSDSERFVMRVAGLYTSLLRNTITRFNPVFGVINAVRDSQMGAMGVFDELGAEGLKLYAKHYAGALAAGARTEVNKSDPQKYQMDRWMREMRFAGGTTGGVFMRDNETIRNELRDAMLAAGIAPNGVMDWAKHNTGTRAVKHVLHALEVIGAVSEHAARLSAYTTAREMGKTPAQAASIGKNLTVNFNRFGEQGQLINTLFLFYNAAVQGSVRISQMAKNPKVQVAFAGMAGVGLSLAFMAASVGGDDEDGQPYWDKIPDWEKERNIIIMLPPGSDSGAKVGKHGRYIKIPMAYGLNVFPVLGYQMADVMRNIKDPTKGSSAGKAAINMVSAVMGSYNPFGGSLSAKPDATWALAVAPTIADPIIQLSQGVDGFGKSTGPTKSQFDNRPDSEIVSGTQHGKVYHRIARYLNEATGGNQAREGGIDLQPGTIKNMGGIVGGGLGKFVGDMLNLGYLGVQDLPIETRDIPVYKAFYGEYDKKAGMSQYYERSQKAMTEFASMKNEMKLGVKRGEYSDEERFLQRMGGQAEDMSKALGELKKWEVSIAEGEGTDKEKEIKRKEVQRVRERLGADYNKDWYREESKLKNGTK